MVDSAGNAGDLGLIFELRRSPCEGTGSPLQYSCLGHPMDRGFWQATVCRVARVRYNLTTKQQQHGGSQLPLGTEPAPRALEGNPTTGTPEKKFLECFQEFHFSFSFGILSIILRIFKVVAAGNLLHNDLVGHYLASSSTAAILQTSITSHEHVLIFIIKPVYKTTKRKMANRRKWLFALTQVFTISNTLPPC